MIAVIIFVFKCGFCNFYVVFYYDTALLEMLQQLPFYKCKDNNVYYLSRGFRSTCGFGSSTTCVFKKQNMRNKE